jgi:hypothetical protein
MRLQASKDSECNIMKSEWRITSQYINGKKEYAVYRLCDVNGIDHSGNRVYATEYMHNKQEAERIAETLNARTGAQYEAERYKS